MVRRGRGKSMLTITIKKDSKSIDVMVNEEQKICSTISVLMEADIFDLKQNDYVIQSERIGKKIEPLCSYRDSHIYNGDILNIECVKR